MSQNRDYPCRCPQDPLDPKDWDFKEHHIEQTYLVMPQPMFFHAPMGMAGLIEKGREFGEKLELEFDDEHWRPLSLDAFFLGEMWLPLKTLSDPHPRVRRETLHLHSKLFRGTLDGLGNATAEFIRGMMRDQTLRWHKRVFFWYPTCNKCVDRKGMDGAVIFVEPKVKKK